MAPNKTLAAQLANEFRELLPNNAVEYFVSYYDYYQPEAYVPQTDTYIEKDSLDQRRGRAAAALGDQQPAHPARRRSWWPASPASTASARRRSTSTAWSASRSARTGTATQLLRRFVDIQYTRNDLAFTRGTFRVRGDTIEIFPVYEEHAVRIEMFGDEVERLMTLHPLTGEIVTEDPELYVFPATHYVAGPERMERAIAGIEAELGERLAELERQGKLLEAQRLRMRTTYDIEMMRQVGCCSGIENYSRHIDGRGPGTAPQHPARLLPRGLPARHRRVATSTVPQIGGMYEGDMSRKRTLVDHGFRLPSAMDNRPLRWEEFLDRDRPDRLPVRDPGPVRAGAGRRASSSRSSGRPA